MAAEFASTVFCLQRMESAVESEIAGGSVIVYSTAAPDKTPDRSNQDAAALIPVSANSAVLVVADGAGGLPSGAKASKLCVEAVEAAIRSDDEESLRTRILDGFERANTAVTDLGVGAASTLAVVGIQEGVLRPYHVGDSTILVVGQRGKQKLATVSHSPVGYQVEAGVLDPSAALHHEDLAVVSNLVGNNDMRIEVGAPLELAPYDTVVVGSDGLFDNLTIEEIIERVRSGPLAKAAEDLVTFCMKRMNDPEEGQPSKPDDLTFVIFRLGGKRPDSRASKPEA